ncbi:MAG: hypothetical protein ACJ77K_05440 [Bacteroidia bacterium]
MNTKETILKLFKEQKELTVKEITGRTGLSKQMVHLVLKQLLESKIVEKFGKTPKTLYRTSSGNGIAEIGSLVVSESEARILKKYFVHVTESGQLLEGPEALTAWSSKRGLSPTATLNEFMDARSDCELQLNDQGIINGINKLKNTKGYDKIHLDHFFYLDFYAIERFGKTRLGTLLHYAKQGQNKILMELLMQETRERMRALIGSCGADGAAFIPPAVKREVQFMRHMQSDLQLSLPLIDIKKLSGLIPVTQRSLQTLDARIQNAEISFIISEKRKFRHVILIDDEANSGATLNQVAGKIRSRGIAEKVSAVAIVGQQKGFEATTEMKIVA